LLGASAATVDEDSDESSEEDEDEEEDQEALPPKVEPHTRTKGFAAAAITENARALASFRTEPAFEAVSTPELKAVLRIARRRVLPRYACAFREGAEAAHFFIVLRGKLALVTADGQAPRHVEVAAGAIEGALIGLEALIGGAAGGDDDSMCRRTYTAEALGDCVVLSLGVAELHEAGLLGAQMLGSIGTRLFSEFVQSKLSAMPIFGGLEPSVMRELAPLWTLEEHGQAGETIFEEGDAGDSFYILTQGRVNLSVSGELLTTLGSEGALGEVDGAREEGLAFFGEMALLDGKPRMAAVHARTPCTLLVLQRQVFKEFLQMVPDFGQRLRSYKELRARQTELNLAIASDRAHMIDATEVDAALSEGLVPRKFSAVANHVNRLVRAANGLGR